MISKNREVAGLFLAVVLEVIDGSGLVWFGVVWLAAVLVDAVALVNLVGLVGNFAALSSGLSIREVCFV